MLNICIIRLGLGFMVTINLKSGVTMRKYKAFKYCYLMTIFATLAI